MRNLILGTAGHIDHGKTALVRALTGVDTDRLAEEKARGITIDLGFAELVEGDVRFGVVDVPGHEGFVRNMLAGATGMDVVLLVVAADEGVMPQTREHLAIVELLGVRRLVVALTKCDLVEEDWLELAREDVRDLLAGGPFAGAPVVPTSAQTGQGLDELRQALLEAVAGTGAEESDDVAFLPVDRVFTVRGTGTVVTGTLWTGRIRTGDRVRLLPEGVDARVRAVQVHGAEAGEGGPGSRVALALTGDRVGTDTLHRGQAVVTLREWEGSRMLTVRLRVLEDAGWSIRHGQRVRVHLGTAEVMARCALLGGESLEPGDEGWAQLRLEAPVAARVRQRLVLRSYSPVTTFAGGEVVETFPPKRRRRSAVPVDPLRAVASGNPQEAVAAALALAGPGGVPEVLLSVVTGLDPGEVAAALPAIRATGGVAAEGRWVGAEVAEELRARMVDRVEGVHAQEPFRPGLPVESLRSLTPAGAPRGLADAVLEGLVEGSVFSMRDGVVARRGFTPSLTAGQEAVRDGVRAAFREAGLQPPAMDALPADWRNDPAFPHLVKGLEASGELVPLDADLYAWGPALEDAGERVRAALGGREGLGPADFKEVLPVSRRYLLPILRYLDGVGVTRNTGDVRAVLKKSS